MDFVVVGFGLGALEVLLGVILRGWLAGRCERTALRAIDPAMAAYDRANAAEYRGAGQALLAAGGAVVLATLGGLAGALDDGTGALLVATTATVATLSIILWGYLYRSRNPMPSRPRRRKALEATSGAQTVDPDLAVAESPADAPALAALNAEIEPDGSYSPDQAPLAGGSDEPQDAEEAAATVAGETRRPIHAERATASDSPKADAPSATADSAPAAASRPDAGAAVNGHPADDAVVAADARMVAYVARGARADAERGAVSDNEEGLEER